MNLPLIGLWGRMLKIPYSILYVIIVIFCQIGAYSVNNNISDVLLMNSFGLVGYLMRLYKFDCASLILALVLGPVFESALRRSLLLSGENPVIFFQRPISVVFLAIALVCLISPLFTRERLGKKVIEMQEE